MRVEVVPPSAWGERLVSAWRELLTKATEPSVFLSPEWVGAWWRAYGEGRQALLLAAWDDRERLSGVAPLYRRRLRLVGVPGPRVIAVMGDEGVGSEYLGVLVRPDRQREFLAALATSLEGEWALADLRGLREAGSLVRELPECLGSREPSRVHRESEPCSLIPLPRDYEAYLASLAPKFRSTLRHRTNKLTKNFSVRLVRTSREEELDTHLGHLFLLHQQRWAAEGHPGSFYDLRKRAFYLEVSAAFLRLGWLRFYHLEVDGVIRACQFGFAFDGVLHSLQEAFDSSFRPPGVGGVGVVLRGMAIRESIVEGLKGYDFLGGAEEFKSRWGTNVHHVQRVRIGAPGLAGAVAFASTAGWRRAKDWGRRRAPGWLLAAREGWRSRRDAARARRQAATSEREKA